MSNEKENLVKVEAYFDYCLFPKAPKVLGEGDNQFGITRWEVSKVISGTIPSPYITVKGTFFEPLDDGFGTYTLLLRPIVHEKYGEQYDLIYLTKYNDLSASKTAQKAFLSRFMTPRQVEEFYKIYSDPIKIIEGHDIEGLKKVRGIGNYIASRILRDYEKHKDFSELYVRLADYNFTQDFLGKLIKHYSSPSLIIDVVTKHPYDMIYDIDGVSFKRADDIALKGGMPPKSPERIKGYILYFLKDKAYNKGNSYVYANQLLSNLYDFFGGKEEIFEAIESIDGTKQSNISVAMQALQDADIVVVEDGSNKADRRVYLKRIYDLEKTIATHLARLKRSSSILKYDNWEASIQTLEEKQGFAFDEVQKNGIHMALKEQVCLICGLAGSGKSTLVSGVLAALRADNPGFTFAQCALSGKAAARLQEVTGSEGMTIHRLLGLGSEMPVNVLSYDLIIVDEISLVGGELFDLLLKAIASGTKLLMLGDLGQLPSIGSLNLAADFYKSPFIPTVELTTIHRQAAKSGIITVSHNVRNQEQLFTVADVGEMTFGELQDMTFNINAEKDLTRQLAFEYFKKYYHSDLVKEQIMDIQMISPVKERGDACVYNLNIDVQNYINPIKEKNESFTVGFNNHLYDVRVNDKVMCIKNNYHLYDLDENEVAVFNGWIGIVAAINATTVHVNFPLAGGVVVIERSEVKDLLVLGYASTVHKLQGSDAPVVIGVLDYSTPPSMLDNALLYTLITRAKKHCVIVGQNGAIRQAISTNHVSKKVTFMCELLEQV